MARCVRRNFLTILMTALLSVVALSESAVAEESTSPCTLEFTIDGAIGPASLDMLERAEKRAASKQCGSILMVLNTPGGSLQTTRLMVEKILASKIPYFCLVAPAGGHAGSAGAILLQACHFSGAFETTNIGAATPVSGTGEQIGEDLRKKLVNDTRSWVEGLAELRGRNKKFAREIVEEARAVSAREALELKAIDWMGTTKEDFLKAAKGGPLVVFEQDLRYRLMDILTNPQFAYMLFMASLGLLYFELTHPGTVAPGVIGAVGLVISLISLHMLNVTWGGVLLIALGIGLMIAEAFVASFGILGIGGIVAFFLGSLFLFDTDVQGFSLPIMTILPTTILLGSLMLGIAYLAFSTRKRRKQGAYDVLIGRSGMISTADEGGHTGFMEIEGEVWKFQSAEELRPGDMVRVERHDGLKLVVGKK